MKLIENTDKTLTFCGCRARLFPRQLGWSKPKQVLFRPAVTAWEQDVRSGCLTDGHGQGLVTSPVITSGGHMTRILGLHASGCQVHIHHANGHAPGPAICSTDMWLQVSWPECWLWTHLGVKPTLFGILTILSFTMVETWGWFVGDVFLCLC